MHAGPNPKYFGPLKVVTWYNLLSNQFTGLNAIPTPGTLRDSLVLLAVVLEQQTELKPTQIMTDTGAYSDVVFGLFRLLGYRFSPRLADIRGTRFWRIDPKAGVPTVNGQKPTLAFIGTSRKCLKRDVPFVPVPGLETGRSVHLLSEPLTHLIDSVGLAANTGIRQQVGDWPH